MCRFLRDVTLGATVDVEPHDLDASETAIVSIPAHVLNPELSCLMFQWPTVDRDSGSGPSIAQGTTGPVQRQLAKCTI
jgi:hypothetical protein